MPSTRVGMDGLSFWTKRNTLCPSLNVAVLCQLRVISLRKTEAELSTVTETISENQVWLGVGVLMRPPRLPLDTPPLPVGRLSKDNLFPVLVTVAGS